MAYNDLALRRAERIGVIEYAVKGNKMVYYSYYGGEGFYKVEHNLDTNAESRKPLSDSYCRSAKWRKLNRYNYFCG